MNLLSITFGFTLHAAMLLPVMLICGTISEPSAWLLFVCVMLFYADESIAADRLARSQAPETFTSPAGNSITTNRLALATGVTLLSIFWIALAKSPMAAVAGTLMPCTGATFMLSGALLRHMAIRRLDAFFISEPRVAQGQPLATDGIYTVVRHPSESGLLAIALGAAVMRSSLPAAVVLLVILVPLVLARLRFEERVLLAGFGEDYRQYCRKTGALLPAWRISSPTGISHLAQGCCEERTVTPGN